MLIGGYARPHELVNLVLFCEVTVVVCEVDRTIRNKQNTKKKNVIFSKSNKKKTTGSHYSVVETTYIPGSEREIDPYNIRWMKTIHLLDKSDHLYVI